MKKISILSLAVLLAAGTGFAGRSLPTGKIVVDDSKQQVSVPLCADEVLGRQDMRKALKKAPVEADAVTGTYIWSNISALLNAGTPATLDMELVDEATGKVVITGWLSGADFKVDGVVDFEEGTLSIPNNQYLGEDPQYGDPTYFYVKGLADDGDIADGAADMDATVGYFDGSAFVFDKYDFWALGDPNDEELGWWFLTYVNELRVQVPIDEVEEGQWKPVGFCTIEDAWILPSYSFEDGSQVIPSDFLYEAELQQNVNDENVYRVWAPYRGDFPLVSQNQSQYFGQIVFDITDPDHVIVEAGHYAGFANINGEFCVFGMLGWHIYGFGEEWDPSYLPTVIEFMETHDQEFDTFKENVLTVNNSVFDTDIACKKAYSWNDNEYVVSKFTFPAGSAVSGVDVENAPVKYYNLQGVKVANPVAGQIVICRQGDKATKKIIK